MGIPRRIGNLKPFAEIARGQAVSVLKAFDPAGDRVVAVKLLRREWMEYAGFAARFAAETSALESVSSPNVVAILGHGECEHGLYLVMEFVDGTALDTILATRTVPLIIGAAIVRDAVVGLAAVHKAGLIHRDFKPANVVVGDEGSVKLVDFGFAEPSAVLSDKVAGTPGYIAPELLTGSTATTSSDIYSAGVTLLEAATGLRLHLGASTPHRNSTIGPGDARHDAPIELAERDADLAGIITRMTDPEPGSRPDAAAVVHALDEVVRNYRPAPDRRVVSKWLAGEPQTLPKRLQLPISRHAENPENARGATPDPESRSPAPPGRPTSPGSPGSGSTARRSVGSAASGNGPWSLVSFLVLATTAVVALLLFSLARQGNITAPDGESSEPMRSASTPPDSVGETARFAPVGERGGANRDSQAAVISLATDGISLDSSSSTRLASQGTGTAPSDAAGAATDPRGNALSDSLDPLTVTNVDAPLADSSLQPDGNEAYGDGRRSDGAGVTAQSALRISAAPWAHIKVDGVTAGTTPIADVIPVVPGEHEVVFSHPLFPDYARTVVIASGDTADVTVSMWKTVARVTLTVSPWAAVLVDGVARDTTPLAAPLIVKPGSSTLTLDHPDLGSWSTRLEFVADSTYDLRYNLFELTRRD